MLPEDINFCLYERRMWEFFTRKPYICIDRTFDFILLREIYYLKSIIAFGFLHHDIVIRSLKQKFTNNKLYFLWL